MAIPAADLMGDPSVPEVVAQQRCRSSPRVRRSTARDPGPPPPRLKRLGHIVVPADGQPLDLVVEVPRGDEDDRDGAARARAAACGSPCESVEVGEHNVEDDEIGLVGGGEVERGGALSAATATRNRRTGARSRAPRMFRPSSTSRRGPGFWSASRAPVRGVRGALACRAGSEQPGQRTWAGGGSRLAGMTRERPDAPAWLRLLATPGRSRRPMPPPWSVAAQIGALVGEVLRRSVGPAEGAGLFMSRRCSSAPHRSSPGQLSAVVALAVALSRLARRLSRPGNTRPFPGAAPLSGLTVLAAAPLRHRRPSVASPTRRSRRWDHAPVHGLDDLAGSGQAPARPLPRLAVLAGPAHPGPDGAPRSPAAPCPRGLPRRAGPDRRVDSVPAAAPEPDLGWTSLALRPSRSFRALSH